jgi:hypothetical protein
MLVIANLHTVMGTRKAFSSETDFEYSKFK